MAGNWPYDPGQGHPTRSSHWLTPKPQQQQQPQPQYSQSTPYGDTYGQRSQAEFLPAPAPIPANSRIHESFFDVRSRVDPTYSKSAALQQHHDDEDLDDFDRELLGSAELPAAHPQSSRRLTLTQAQPTIAPAIQPAHHGHDYSDFSAGQFYAGYQEPVPQYSLPQHPTYLSELNLGQGMSHGRDQEQDRPYQVLLPAATPDLNWDQGHGHVPTQAEVHQYQELHPAMLQPRKTPTSHSAQHAYAQAQDPVTPPFVRSSSDAGSPSPSAGVSLRRQRRSYAFPQRNAPSIAVPKQEAAHPVMDRARAPPVVNGIQLVSPRQAFPDNLRFRSIFPHDLFNAVQSKCFDTAYGSNDNLVVSAPTGSGKTAILELAMCRIIGNRGNDNIKIVYQAPTKALCSERAGDWEEKFSSLNIKVAELTGDTSQTQMGKVREASIIVTTPEKWDSITRKWKDHQKLLELVRLFLIDEVHMLKDVRGATLEAVVSRMKTSGNNVRFVALSATVPNSEDVAAWLGLNHENQHLSAQLQTFGQEFRPVKLVRHVFGYAKHMNDYAFDKHLDTQLPGLLAKYTSGKPILVFCFTRKSCERTAEILANLPQNQRTWHEPATHIRVVGKELQETVKAGVAFHHAGLDQGDRQTIEKAFLDGHLSVICCTSTLAVGVNLPCHTVVLKGTATFLNNSIQELSDLEVMQMLGRAGRPQFDDSANALILTSSDQKERYKRMVDGEEILESTLHLNLIEHLNSEIGLRTIRDMDSARKWLGGTFLSVRMRKNPDYYRLPEDAAGVKNTDSILEQICQRNINLLQEAGIITRDRGIRQTEIGVAMAKYMVQFDSMKLILELPRALTMEQLLNALCKANELREYKLKPPELTIWREVNKSSLTRYPLQENVNKTWHKISLVVQLWLGGGDLPDNSETQKLKTQLRMEKKGIFERLQRLARCTADCMVVAHDSSSTKTALELFRSLAADAWEGFPAQLLQIPFIGPVTMRKLVSQNIRTVKDLLTKNHGELEYVVGRQPPFGKKLVDTLINFPLLHIDLSIPSRKNIKASGDAVTVPVMATLRYLNQTGLPKWNNSIPQVTFLAETSAGLLCHMWKGSLGKFETGKGLELPFQADITARDQQIVCHVSCEEIVGTIVTKTLDHSLPAAAFKKKAQPVVASDETRSGHNVEQAVPKKVTSHPSVGRSETGLDGFMDDLDDADAVQAAESFTEHPNGHQDQNDDAGKGGHSQESEETNYGEAPVLDDILDVFDTPRPLAPKPSEQHSRQETTTPGRKDAAGQSTPAHNLSASDSSREPSTPGDTVDRPPVKLPNGKYQCNHACTGGALTKAGKKCTHRCCIEGLDKPRKLQPRGSSSKKRKADGSLDQGVAEQLTVSSPADRVNTAGSVTKKQKTSQQPASNLKNAGSATSQPMPHGSSVVASSPMTEAGTEHRDLSNINEDEEFPDLLVLASQRNKDKATKGAKDKATEKAKGKTRQNDKDGKNQAAGAGKRKSMGPGVQEAGSATTDQANGSQTSAPGILGCSQPLGAEDYLPTAPPATTTDFGDLDDDVFDNMSSQFSGFDIPYESGSGLDEPGSPVAQAQPDLDSDTMSKPASVSVAQDDPPPSSTLSQPAAQGEGDKSGSGPYADLSPNSKWRMELKQASELLDLNSANDFSFEWQQDQAAPPSQQLVQPQRLFQPEPLFPTQQQFEPTQQLSEPQQLDNGTPQEPQFQPPQQGHSDMSDPFHEYNDMLEEDGGNVSLTDHTTPANDSLGRASPSPAAFTAGMLGGSLSGGSLGPDDNTANNNGGILFPGEEEKNDEADPAWVEEFGDPEFLDGFRDVVKFVD